MKKLEEYVISIPDFPSRGLFSVISLQFYRIRMD